MNAAARLVEVRVPDMGNFKDVAVIDVLVKPGETIEPEAPLVTLETEKATMDVPSTASGVVEKVHVAKGGRVSPGDLVVTLRSEAAGADAPAPSAGAGEGSPGGGGVARSPGGAAVTGGGGAGAGGAAATGTGGAAAAATGAGGAAAIGAGGAGATGAGGAGATGAGGAGATGAGGAAASGAGGAATGGRSAAPSASATAATQSTTPPGPRPSMSSGAAGAPAEAQAPRASGPARTDGVAQIRTDLPLINEPGFSRAHAGPSVRLLARELGVDLTNVKGTGFKGRITHDDVKAYVKKALSGGTPAPATAPGGGVLPAVPVVDFAQFGPVETKPLSRIQKISGPRLHASWVNIPHVTQFDEADITDLEALRAKLKQTAQDAGIKLTPLAFIVRACVKALQQFPLFNSSLDPSGTHLVLKKYIHIGFAADTPNGLVVPVVRDANQKDIYKTARQLGELSEKARTGKLSMADMQGGCFTISSLGGIGGTAFTPIINAPEVAILGVSRSAMRPVFRDGNFVPRLILPLSLSYDHRVIDGALAARWTTFLAQTLANPHELVEAIP
jgi:pyruvate dehydrogenase E2 component (dihydrolipoamide acetyltransferase)